MKSKKSYWHLNWWTPNHCFHSQRMLFKVVLRLNIEFIRLLADINKLFWLAPNDPCWQIHFTLPSLQDKSQCLKDFGKHSMYWPPVQPGDNTKTLDRPPRSNWLYHNSAKVFLNTASPQIYSYFYLWKFLITWYLIWKSEWDIFWSLK